MRLKRVLKIGAGAGAFGACVMAVRDVMLSGGGATSNPLRFAGNGALQLLLYAVIGALLGALISLVIPGLIRVLSRQRSDASYAYGGSLLLLAGSAMLLGTPAPGAEEPPAVVFTLVASILLAMGGVLLAGAIVADRKPNWVPIGFATLVGAAILFGGMRATLASIIPASAPGYLGIGLAALVAFLIAYWLMRWLESILAARWSQRGATWGLAVAMIAPILVLVVWTIVPRGGSDTIASKRKIHPSGDTSRPNVILISVDTLRADYVGYAGGPAKTPNLDDLAAKSHVFTNASSAAPWTKPSFAASLSGRYPSEVGVGRTSSGRGGGVWKPSVPSLAEAFQNNEYYTAAVVSNVVLSRAAGFDKGFDTFVHTTHDSAQKRLAPCFQLLNSLNPWGEDVWSPRFERERADVTTPVCIRQLERTSQPVLFWVHYNDPHDPYDAPNVSADYHVRFSGSELHSTEAGRVNNSPAVRERFVQAYIREIEYFDNWLGKLLSAISESGIGEDSILIVFWSDHGEEFWDHGGYYHGQSLHSELLHVPLMVRLPAQLQSRAISEPVSLVDLTPTLLDAVKLEEPRGLRGRSLLPLIEGTNNDTGNFAYFAEACCQNSVRKALIRGDYKLIYDVYRDSFRLYDLADDPHEEHNIYGISAAPDTTEMKEELLGWTQKSLTLMDEHLNARGASQMSPEIRQQLRDMGYVQ